MAKITISDLSSANDRVLSGSDTFLNDLSENECVAVFGGNAFQIFATTLLKAFAAYLIYLIVTNQSSK
ncbi:MULTISPECIES: hypothetical protein [Nostocales]|uniref:Uncharacterized protein n=3 Tax=Nostocales TaxID=1161 RepID=A0A0C1MZ33_9CYAN|nr:hypothetical protein [Tolypothrix bouteillei]KAF3888924.1 hypothetical protein DA73_0400028150 [Tolypothrix bouteillei VB521301]